MTGLDDGPVAEVSVQLFESNAASHFTALRNVNVGRDLPSTFITESKKCIKR